MIIPDNNQINFIVMESVMKRRNVLGLDILPSRDAFYGVILDENGIKIWEGTLTRNELPKLITAYKVDRIAIDNIFELYPSQEEIISFLRKNKVRLIQVTGVPGRMKKLSQITAELGLWRGGKLSPRDAARLSAILAINGIGAEVSIFDDLTEIIISRTRSLGEGGQHQSKYARVIAAAIHSATKEVEDKLQKANIGYDIFRHEGDYGLKGAKILAYAPFSKVKNIIGEYHGSLFRVELRPVEHQRLIFLGHKRLTLSKRYVICGIDPGETVAIAILDLNGKPLKIISRKFMAVSEILEEIYELGKPIIIAADVPKIPQLIEFLASKTGAIIIKPQSTLSNVEKNNIVNELGYEISNVHERDALVAAFLAYNKYKPILQKIDKILSYFPLKLESDEIKKDVIFGLSIKEAIQKHFWKEINKIIELRSEKIHERKSAREKKLIDNINKLSKRLAKSYAERNKLLKKIDELRTEISLKDSEIRRLQDIIDRLQMKKRRISEEEIRRLGIIKLKELEEQNRSLKALIRKLRAEINFLQNVINNLQKIVMKGPDEIVIKSLNALTMDDIELLEKTYLIIPEDVIIIHSWERASQKALRYLKKKGVNIIIALDEPPKSIVEESKKIEVNILYLEDFEDIDLSGDVIIISKEVLSKALRRAARREMSDIDAMYDYLEEIVTDLRKRKISREKVE